MFWIHKYGFTNLSYKALYSFQSIRLFILFRIVDPVMHYFFYATLVSAMIGSDYLSFVVIGNIASYTCHTIMINFMTMFRFERRYGTLELNIASPTPTLWIIIRKAVVPLLDGMFVFAIGLLIGWVIFGVALPLNQIGNVFVLFVVTLFSILSFSLLFACLSLLFSNVNLFLNLALAIFQVFCGVNFSVTLLPSGLEFFARILPLTHSIEALRSIYGIESFAIYPLLGKELLIGFCYLIVSLLFVSVMEKAARKRGALLKSI
ncbi:ABC transporter permease [Lentibacillus sediminis]|uniref:ABC transporter permease n=1 Tax=Lentibacillus sediminis TaxID=1940529 RepID=UPI000C1C0988|nr:ABC transporter permease [Lentibacillus sediminis]